MITIECVNKKDLPALSELYDQVTGTKSNAADVETVYHKIKDNPLYQILVAKDGDQKIAGTAMGIICHDLTGGCRPFLVVENVMVDAAYRRQGIGRILMNSLESFARENRCTYMILVSNARLQTAHRFYEALGFPKDNVKGYRKDLT